MHIKEFGVEIWMNAHENQCQLNLAETCVASLTVWELLDMVGDRASVIDDLLNMRLTYGAIEGTSRLRAAVAALYGSKTAADVLVTHGAIGANALVFHALINPGDAVVVMLPSYQQHYSIPESLGADVRPLWLRPEDGYLPDLDLLRELCQDGARLIALTNPNNPTGSLIDRGMLEQIVGIARDSGAWLLVDEVYRGVDQEGDGFTASVVDLYDRGISTGSMSKTYALAGLRIGWIVAPAEVLHAAMIHRDYTTISVSMIDDHLAAIALEARDVVLARSREITRGNLAILADWIDGEPTLSWVKPRSGTTALLRYAAPISSTKFCSRLLDQTGVLLVPGVAFDMDGHVRIGYANSPAILTEGLSRMSGFLRGL